MQPPVDHLPAGFLTSEVRLEGGRAWKWAGLEPSVEEDADGEDGESEEEDAEERLAPARGTAVLGELREAKNSPEGGPVRGRGGSGRSSGEPGRGWVDGVAVEARVPR